MGYTTDFSGRFDLNQPLTPFMKEFLTNFNETRRMKRNLPEKFGIEGEFFVEGEGFGSQRETEAKSVLNMNEPPSTQPSLWCQWTPTSDDCGIEWDGGEKFYNYTEWLVYLIHKVLAPNGYVLNGKVIWHGEETGDVGKIIVENNRVFTHPWEGEKTEVTPESCSTYNFPAGNVTNFMRTDVVFLEPTTPVNVEPEIVDEVEQPKEYTAEDMKQFGLFLGANLKKYKGKSIDEIFEVFINPVKI